MVGRGSASLAAGGWYVVAASRLGRQEGLAGDRPEIDHQPVVRRGSGRRQHEGLVDLHRLV